MKQQGEYYDEFKAQVIEMAMHPGATKAGVSMILGVNPNTLAVWINDSKKPGQYYSESFFGSLKTELVHNKKYKTIAEARRDIFDYVEVFYNKERLHSTLGYMSPE